MADGKADEQTTAGATSGPKGGDVVQLALNGKWNAEHGDPDAAARQAAIVRMVTDGQQ